MIEYEKDGKLPTNPDIFGPIEHRLYLIANPSEWKYSYKPNLSNPIIERLKNNIFNLEKTLTLKKLYSVLNMIEDLMDNIDDIKNQTDERFFSDFWDSEPLANKQYKFKLFTLKELEDYKHHLELLSSFIEKSKVTSSSPKIKTDLSVSEIAYLFKILIDEKIIIIPKGKKEQFFRTISDIFGSNNPKQSGKIKREYFKKLFNSPSEKTIKFWHRKFTKLKEKAFEDKEFYRS